jgi:hypothetical protein
VFGQNALDTEVHTFDVGHLAKVDHVGTRWPRDDPAGAVADQPVRVLQGLCPLKWCTTFPLVNGVASP